MSDERRARARRQTLPRIFDDYAERPAHLFRLFSTAARRQGFSHGSAASFRLFTSRDAPPCSVTPEKQQDASDQCLPPKQSRLRVPVLAGSRCVRHICTWRGTTGFGARRVAGETMRFTTLVSLRWAASQVPLLSGMFSSMGPMPPTSDIRVALPRQFSVGLSRLRASPPGRELPRLVLPPRREAAMVFRIPDAFHR